MKATRAICVLVILLTAAADLLASGLVGIYGIVEKVVFEPNETSPVRIQVWGAFSFVDGGVSPTGPTSTPQGGYLYFTLPSGNELAAKTEWADLKAVAGSGQAIGFGSWGYIGAFDGLARRTSTTNGNPPYFLSSTPGRAAADVRVRPESEAPAGPAIYSTNTGIVKLTEQGSHADIVKQLKDALRTR